MRIDRSVFKKLACLPLSAAIACLMSPAQAAVPPDIEAGLVKIGHIVDPACTAKLYRPLMPKNDIASSEAQPYPGLQVLRNQSFGPDPKDVVDIFVGDKGSAKRTVLIFVPGGAGNKTELQDKAANAFYDNIGRWAAKQGMVGVLMQRKPSTSWDGGAKDVSSMVQWVEAHIGEHHGDPERMFIWAHSAGNGPTGTYVGRPELWGPKGVGVKGYIDMSGAPFDIAPQSPPPMTVGGLIGDAGKTCSDAVGMASAGSDAGALPGVAPGGPGGPMPKGAPPPAPPAQPDAATLLARSSLPELQKAPFRMLIVNGELDPDALMTIGKNLHEAVCKAGAEHCPQFLIAKGHSHMSLVFSIDTPDTTVSDMVSRFIHDTK